MADALVQGLGLGHRFGAGPWLFRDLDLAIAPGESVAILGPNGRGKSTLLQLLTGVRTPVEGRVQRSCRLAFTPQAFSTAFAFTAFDLVLTGRSRGISLLGQPSIRDEEATRTALEAVGMAWAAERSFPTLSGGERQLVLLARALASKANLLILDEPTAALDLRHQQQVLGWMRRLVEKGMSIIFTTHDPTQALQVATRSLLLFEDAKHTQAETAKVLSETLLTRLYGVKIREATIACAAQTSKAFIASPE